MDLRNLLIITGNLGAKPVVKLIKTKDNKQVKVTEGSLAINNSKDEKPLWLDFQIWGDMPAELVGGLSKGDKLQLSGALSCNTVDNKRYYRLDAETFQLFTKPQQTESTQTDDS